MLLLAEGGAKLHLGSDDAPCAYLEAEIFANEGHLGSSEFTAIAAAEISRILGIDQQSIFVRFGDIAAWGFWSATRATS